MRFARGTVESPLGYPLRLAAKYRRTGSFGRLPGRLQRTIQVRLFPVALYALHFVNWIGTNMPRESKGTAT